MQRKRKPNNPVEEIFIVYTLLHLLKCIARDAQYQLSSLGHAMEEVIDHKSVINNLLDSLPGSETQKRPK